MAVSASGARLGACLRIDIEKGARGQATRGGQKRGSAAWVHSLSNPACSERSEMLVVIFKRRLKNRIKLGTKAENGH